MAATGTSTTTRPGDLTTERKGKPEGNGGRAREAAADHRDPGRVVDDLAAAAVDGIADRKIQRLGRLTAIPRHLRDAHAHLIDAEAADHLADLLAALEEILASGQPAPPSLHGDFGAALARWGAERGFDLDAGPA